MKKGNNRQGIPPNDSPPARNDFSNAKIKGSVHVGDNNNYYYFSPASPTNNGSPPSSEQPPDEVTKEKRTSKKSKATKIVLIGVGTISVLSIIAFVLMRCKDEITQDGLIAVCEAISSMFSFFSLLFSK